MQVQVLMDMNRVQVQLRKQLQMPELELIG